MSNNEDNNSHDPALSHYVNQLHLLFKLFCFYHLRLELNAKADNKWYAHMKILHVYQI